MKQSLFKTMGNLLLYKEPKNKELGFELLENENEGAPQEIPVDLNKMPEADKGQKSPPEAGKMKLAKAPLTVSEWNNDRKKSENTCKPQMDTDIISGELCVNLETIKQKFLMPKNQDIVIREFKIGRKIRAFLVYMEGMVDTNTLNLSIFPQLMSKDVFDETDQTNMNQTNMNQTNMNQTNMDQTNMDHSNMGQANVVDYLIENVLTINNIKKTNSYGHTVMQVVNGGSALFVEGCSQCILIETKGYEKRSVEKPVTESVVRGSQEGFTENLRTNVTLVRRIIKNEKLVTEILPIGNSNHSNCAVMYLEGTANPNVIAEVMRRLKKIDSDLVSGDGMVEQFIEDNPFMLYPQVLSTERPDRTAGFIMEGQVVIIADGTPFALSVPVTFFRLFQTSEDISIRWPYGSFLRIIRLLGLFCATWLPGLYVAMTLFHSEMIPTELLHSILLARETVPFPTLLEVLIMELSFELIREGGIRVPSVIGQTLGIVGALILGQAAVSAGLVSPILVIVVSVTGLGSFVIPNYTLGLTIRIERFLFIFAGAFLGFYGIALLTVLITGLACSMKSFGVPFLAPIAPNTKTNQDVVLRHPIWMYKERPDQLNTPNRKRQGDNVNIWINQENKNKK